MAIFGKKRSDEMSFLEHLEELRWHVVRALLSILIIAIAVFVHKSFIFSTIIMGPREESFVTYQFLCWLSGKVQLGTALCLEQIPFTLQNIDMAGQFLTHMKVSAILGFVAAFPYVFWEFWRFVKPALYDKEIRYTRGLVLVTSFLFILGVLFGYFLIVPFSINFLGSYQVDPQVANQINLDSYITIVSMISLASGIIFELPIAVYFLSKVGLVTPEFMKKYRKHSIVAIMVISAVITPPDVTSQILISIPIVILYELSIGISRRVQRQREKTAL